ncbi:MAG: MFS transporter, partial [Acidimicrobiia bacterium]
MTSSGALVLGQGHGGHGGHGGRDRSYLRRLLSTLALVALFHGFVSALPSAALADIAAAFGFTSADDQALVRAIALVGIGSFAGILLSPLSDRLGRKPFLVWATVGAAVLSAAAGVSSALGLFALLEFAARALSVSAYAAAIAVASEEFPSEERGWVTGVVTGTGAAGLVAATVLEAGVGAISNYRGVFLLSLTGLLVAWLVSRVEETNRWSSLTARGVGHSLARMGFRTEMMQVGLVFFLTYFALFGAGGWWGLFASRERGLEAGVVGAGLAAAYLAGVAGHFVSGWLQDSMGRRRTATAFLLAGALVSAGVFTARGQLLVLATVMIAGFFGFGASAPLTALAAELFQTEARVTSIAIVRTGFGTLGAILGPLTVGWLAGGELIRGIGEAALLVIVLSLLPAVILLQYLPETVRRDLESIEAATEAISAAFVPRVTEPYRPPTGPSA